MNFSNKTNQIAVKKRIFKVAAFLTFVSLLLLVANENINRKTIKFVKTSVNSKTFNRSSTKFEKKTVGMQDLIARNITKKAEIELLVYDRVSKAGSKMLTQLLRDLGEINNFTVYFEERPKTEKVQLSTFHQRNISTTISKLPQPAAFSRHFPYINFEEYNNPKPIYINMVRDPVERLISLFYYQRSETYQNYERETFPEKPPPDEKWLQKDFADCVLSGDPECNYTDDSYQTTYFCGNGDECFNLRILEAFFNQSKHHLENEYAVVGVLEELNKTLAVFEKYIPRFFAGATETYFKSQTKMESVNKTKDKPKVDEKIKDIVRKKQPREHEFYEFCKKRLNSQFLATLE